MKHFSLRLFAFGMALGVVGAAVVLAANAYARTARPARTTSSDEPASAASVGGFTADEQNNIDVYRSARDVNSARARLPSRGRS